MGLFPVVQTGVGSNLADLGYANPGIRLGLIAYERNFRGEVL